MTNLEWLLGGDPVIVHLVRKYLLDEPSETHNQGLIQQYLDRIDPQTLMWGNGYYGPKWISTHYTLLELREMDIMPGTPVYRDSLIHYLDHEWQHRISPRGIESMDLCITGMLINLLAYGMIDDPRLRQMIDYVLDHPMADGGWNCRWNHSPFPAISSVHTTINVLEGLAEYRREGFAYRCQEVDRAILQGIQVLLDRQLIYVKNTRTPIHPEMARHHYPPRWKYDYLRILEFLARRHDPLHDDMEPALTLLEQHIVNGRLTRGSRVPGLIHFPLELERYGRFNTLRAYIVLKEYRPELYQQCIKGGNSV